MVTKTEEVEEEIKNYFNKTVEDNPNLSVGMVAIMTLMKTIEDYEIKTIQHFDGLLKNIILIMKSFDYPIAAIDSSCELFMRFVTYTPLDKQDFDECKQMMIRRGTKYLKRVKGARDKIAKSASQFISQNSKILTHSRSRVVLATFKEAQKQNRQFEVYVTQCALDKSGEQMCDDLKALGIPHTLIVDSAVGSVMERVDLVMMGAEAVVQSGGIINKVGSYTIGLCAKDMHIPFYVLAESFKFNRYFPLNQSDIPKEYKYKNSLIKSDCDLSKVHPLVDYTPPSCVTLLVCDIGILPPSAVCDELIKLYL